MNDIYQGVVLAGGESRRFGSPKAFAEIDGIPFYQCSINAIQPFCPSIVIVTKPNLQEKFKRDRLAADGKMYTCLFATDGFDLKQLLRSGADDHKLTETIMQIWGARTDRYSDERTEETARNRKKIEMSYIGG